MANILIIDDDHVFCDVLSRRINRLGHHSVFSLTLEDGKKMALTGRFDVIMLDVQLPDGNGIDAIADFQKLEYSPEVIIITGSGNPDGAELAIKWGAWDYVEKPASVQQITLPLVRALDYRKEKLVQEKPLILKRDNIIGSSAQITKCLEQVVKAANSDVSVLIQGETGTGKELLARAIHENSDRSNEPFVIVDCGAIPETLVEGILFGHEKGTFTGAEKKQVGLVEQANKGTLFLDEIGELPIFTQKAFLRVIQERKYRPLGSKTEKASNFRLVSATNRSLSEMVKKDQFREDLLYRIRSFSIVSPPLRDRQEDISNLVMYYIAKKCDTSGILTKGFSPDFFDIINTYTWPGNVRELFNSLDSAMAYAGDEPILYPQHLPVNIRTEIAKSSIQTSLEPTDLDHTIDPEAISTQTLMAQEKLDTFKEFKYRLMEAGEKQYFYRICDISKGNAAEACRLSGLSKSRFYFFLQKHDITLTDYK